MQNIKVSIIVPVYNTADYLNRCLDSCVNQTLREIEVIVVNDCSPDPRDGEIMREYEKKFPNKVRCFWHEKNKRQGGARNTGIRAACGEFLYFADSDDYLDLKLCEKMYNAIIAENADMAVCDCNYIDDNIVTEHWSWSYAGNNGKFDSPDLCNRIKDMKMHNIWLIVVKKSIIQNNNLYFPEYTVADDMTSILWFSASSKIVRLNEALYYYVKRQNSLMNSRNMQCYILVIKTVEYILSSNYFSNLDTSVKKLLFLYLSRIVMYDCYAVCMKYPAEFVNFCNNVLALFKLYKVNYDDSIYTQSEDGIWIRDVFCFIELNIGLLDFYFEFIAFWNTYYVKQQIQQDKVMQLKKLRSCISSYIGKRLTLWGCGYFGKQNAENMSIMNIKFELTDTNAKIHGESIANVVVKPWDELKDCTDVVLVSAKGIFDEVNARLSKECPDIKVVDLIEMLRMAILRNFKVVLFGAGGNAKPALKYLNDNGIEVAYFVDNNRDIKSLDTYAVHTPEILLTENKSNLRIIITPDFPIYKDMETQLLEMGLKECLCSTHSLSCATMLYFLGFIDNSIRFCCKSISDFHPTPPAFPYLDNAEATIINFIQKRKAFVQGIVPIECAGCSLLRSHNVFDCKIKEINISCYPSPCQAKCIYCGVHTNLECNYQNAKSSRYPKMIVQMIQYLQKNNLIDNNCLFSIAPAEITIMPHKDLLLDAVSKYKAKFLTNAFLFDTKIANSMIKNNSIIQVSLDSGTKETFKLVKGYDLFEKVLANLKKYREHNVFWLKYNILSGVNDGDADIEGIVEILKLLNLDSLRLSFEHGMPLRTAFYPIVKFVAKLEENTLSFDFHAYYTTSQIKDFVKLYLNSASENYYIEKNNNLREVFKNEYLNDYNGYKEYVYRNEIKELFECLNVQDRIALLGKIHKNQRLVAGLKQLGIPVQIPDLVLEESYDAVKDSADIFIVPERRLFNGIKQYVESKGGESKRLLDIEKYLYSFEPPVLFLKNSL